MWYISVADYVRVYSTYHLFVAAASGLTPGKTTAVSLSFVSWPLRGAHYISDLSDPQFFPLLWRTQHQSDVLNPNVCRDLGSSAHVFAETSESWRAPRNSVASHLSPVWVRGRAKREMGKLTLAWRRTEFARRTKCAMALQTPCVFRPKLATDSNKSQVPHVKLW